MRLDGVEIAKAKDGDWVRFENGTGQWVALVRDFYPGIYCEIFDPNDASELLRKRTVITTAEFDETPDGAVKQFLRLRAYDAREAVSELVREMER